MLSPPVEHSGWLCVDRKDRWPLQVDYNTNRKEVVPQVLAGPPATVSLPGGERWMTICPPAWPFTACLTALALGECWARRDRAGPGLNRRGSLSLRVCVCMSCSLNTAADQAQDPVDSQLASQSAAVRGTAALCCTMLQFCKQFLTSLLGCCIFHHC